MILRRCNIFEFQFEKKTAVAKLRNARVKNKGERVRRKRGRVMVGSILCLRACFQRNLPSVGLPNPHQKKDALRWTRASPFPRGGRSKAPRGCLSAVYPSKEGRWFPNNFRARDGSQTRIAPVRPAGIRSEGKNFEAHRRSPQRS